MATTCPLGPARSGSQVGTVGPTAPTSRHRRPSPTPTVSKCRNVDGSKSVGSAVNRSPAPACQLSKR
ncbi:hypothetical protein GCM10017744_004360 [Streptomyces antimycoticus]|uniref:hypothetical protein n=1 Tax=Streptomyces antimycoticus TaxID=68175 RepID=UPI0026894FDE